MVRIYFVAMAFLLAAWSPWLMADATLKMQRMVDNRVTQELEMWVKGDRIRLGKLEDISGYVVFDRNAKTITQIDDAKKVYRVVDQKTVAQLRSTLDALQNKVLADLPPEQREKMQALIGQAVGKMAPTSALPGPGVATLRNTGQTLKVRGRHCELIEQLMLQEKVRDICVVQPEALGLSKADLQAAKSFYEYVRQVAEQLPGGEVLVDQLALWNPLLNRVPVQVKRYDEGKVETVYEMASVATDSLDAALFVVPKNYRRVALTPEAP